MACVKNTGLFVIKNEQNSNSTPCCTMWHDKVLSEEKYYYAIPVALNVAVVEPGPVNVQVTVVSADAAAEVIV